MLQKADIKCLAGDRKVQSHLSASITVKEKKCMSMWEFNGVWIYRQSLDLSEFTNLKTITFQEKSFSDSSSLTLPNSVTALTFGKDTFTNLKFSSLTLPPNLRSLTFSEGSVKGENQVYLNGHQQIRTILFNANSFNNGQLSLVSMHFLFIQL